MSLHCSKSIVDILGQFTLYIYNLAYQKLLYVNKKEDAKLSPGRKYTMDIMAFKFLSVVLKMYNFGVDLN